MSADARDLAERTLALAAGEQLQVTVRVTTGRLTRFDDDGPDHRATDERTTSVLVLRSGHPGVADAADATDAALAAAVDAAVRDAEAAAGAARAPGPHPGLPAPAPVRDHPGYDSATARHDPAHAEAVIAGVRAAAAGHQPVGAWSTCVTMTAIASSTGLRLADQATRAVLDVTVRDASTGHEQSAVGAATAAAGVDPTEVTRRASTLLLPTAAAAVEPGAVTVVLGPEAVAALLTLLGRTAFDGLAHVEGRGALVGRLGRRVAASAINLADSPRFARTLPQAFDLDGVPKAPVPLIQDGVAHRVVHDLRSAARAGGAARSTGHATAPGGAPDGPRPSNLVLIGGGATDLAELCEPIEHGLLVPHLVYEAGCDHAPVATARGAVRLEAGRPTTSAPDLRLAGDPLDVLLGTQALTSAQWLIPATDAASVVAPALRTTGLAVVS